MVLLMALPPFIEIQIGLTLLVSAYPDCPGKEAGKWVDTLCTFVPVLSLL